MWWLPCAIKKAVLDAYRDVTTKSAFFSRCLAEFYLQHTAKSVNQCVVWQDAVIMFKISLDAAKDSGKVWAVLAQRAACIRH